MAQTCDAWKACVTINSMEEASKISIPYMAL